MIVLSEEDYNNLMETIYISSNKELKEEVKEGLKEPLEDCVSEDEVDL